MTNPWAFLEELAIEPAETGGYDLGDSIATLLAERLTSAVCAENGVALAFAETALQRLYLQLLRASPESASDAARGEDGGGSPEAAAFALGQVGLAHAVAAAAAAKRVDPAFERRLLSRQFEQVVRALIDHSLAGREIADLLGKDEADISRRLKILRRMGAVECRREGNRIVNFLTEAARTVARARGMGTLGAVANRTFSPEVVIALDDQRKSLPDELRHSLVLSVPDEMRRAS